MYYSSTSVETLGVVQMRCPLCGEVANTAIKRESSYLMILIAINLWYHGDLFATCGNCHGEYRIDDKETCKALEEVGIDVKASYLVRDLVALGIPALVVLGIVLLG